MDQYVLFNCVGLDASVSVGLASAAATMFFSNRATPDFKNPLTGFATGPMSGWAAVVPPAGGALAAGAACCANATPDPINIDTATIQLARSFITGSFSGLSLERILLRIFLGKVFDRLVDQPSCPRVS